MPPQTIHTQASASSPPPPSSSNNLLFTCTFCWHLSSGPPRVACGELVLRGDEAVSLGWCFWHRACYGCLLCGNRAVAVGPRVGDLFCDEGEGEGEGEGDEERGGEEGGRAKEIEDIPMCAHCVVSCEVEDEPDREQVAQRALRRVDRVDGGLSRKRWERERRGDGSTVVNRKARGAIRRVPGKIPRAVEGLSTRYQQPPQSSPHGRAPYESHVAGDGTLSGQAGSNESAVHCVVPLDSTIYVSIFDPVDAPAFKPSPTKPIPRWMQMLPGQRTQYRKRQPRPRSILDAHFRPASATMSVKTPPPPPLTLCPTTVTTTKPSKVPNLIPASRTTPSPPPATPRRSPFLLHLDLRRRRRSKSRESMSSHSSELETAPAPETQPHLAAPFRGHSLVADEPLQRPHSHSHSHVAAAAAAARRQHHHQHHHREGEPEYADAKGTRSHVEKEDKEEQQATATPLPPAATTTMTKGKRVQPTNNRRGPPFPFPFPSPSPSSSVTAAAPQQAASPRLARKHRHRTTTPPAQSTEYLSLYRSRPPPARGWPRAAQGAGAWVSASASASAAVPGRGRSRVVGGGRRGVERELELELGRRRRVRKEGGGGVSGDSRGGRRSMERGELGQG
ncbi:hypothetical protein F4809DRAFT_660580 [Biscogniauxia mediterranea]|nr:hypothetical protein F4809DRAFT_660580 [Biscogniauxia mediterranea]